MSKAYKWVSLFTSPDGLRSLLVGSRFSDKSGLSVQYMVKKPEGTTIHTTSSQALNEFNKPWSDSFRKSLVTEESKLILPK